MNLKQWERERPFRKLGTFALLPTPIDAYVVIAFRHAQRTHYASDQSIMGSIYKSQTAAITFIDLLSESEPIRKQKIICTLKIILLPSMNRFRNAVIPQVGWKVHVEFD